MLVFVVIWWTCSVSTVLTLSVYSDVKRGFEFPDDNPNYDFSGLERQALPVYVPALPQLATFPPPLSIFPVTAQAANPALVAVPAALPLPSTTNGQTCVCVPTGTCPVATAPQGNTDGSGLLDIRIVTNASNVIATPVAASITCGTGLVSCCQAGPYQCGVQYPPVAGSPVPAAGQAPYGAYPWQAVLLGPGGVYVGSGVLLNAQNVLTVAHKVTQFVTSPATLTVRMGEWNAAGVNEPIAAQDFVVSRVTLHPSFNNLNLKNDVAVLRLSLAVNLGTTPTIATACLPVVPFTGTRCWVSGWGRNDFAAGTYQAIQKQVDVPILQTAVCQQELSATRLGAQFVFDPASFICAGGEPGKDACTGDGGSPLVCSLGNRWFVTGLVAWGIGCGTNVVPGVYVNVQTFIPWIQQVVVAP